MKTQAQLSDWFIAANKLESLFRHWQAQDDEYGHALRGLAPEDRDPEQERAQRQRINAAREKLIRAAVMEIPAVAELLDRADELLGVLSPLLVYLKDQGGRWADVIDGADNLRAAIAKATGEITTSI